MRTTFLGAIFGLTTIVMGALACGAETSGGGGSATTSSTTSTGGGGTGGGTTTGSGGTMTGGSGGTTTGPVYGYCTKPCGILADCCPAGTPDCPSNMYPYNYQCDKGVCLSPRCMSTADCEAVDPAQDCFSLSGVPACLIACAVDGDCTAPAACAGVDDSGKKYCMVVGGGCTDDASCSGFGKCVDKVCVCAVDGDCTFNGYTKCAL